VAIKASAAKANINFFIRILLGFLFKSTGEKQPFSTVIEKIPETREARQGFFSK